ncbi:unnamed protein product [Bursaphelenchus xylophilus]|uniref:(pine wood nematode) hypothetical protein n=1 Tax=Bursaphelenchus xylophilus TaxID=6326 RepID=A0A1I7S908_BURXY|nr:unnamed protein product [Bursaphelenchus xylophilus]CAG9086108.1 unnamed protein product [Bursaphelenchus xylophilus]
MFARKAKSSDVQSSLQRFSDLTRDTSSRTKHLRIVYDTLSEDEKRQFCNEYSFEIFHLIDTVLSNLDLVIDSQGVFEAESALWALEQLLCNIPDLVGKGWQRNGIETIMRRGLHPGNMFAVRKISIRLFLMWYQSLHVYGNDDAYLDEVCQSLLPFFPLTSKIPTARTLLRYCEGKNYNATVGFNPAPPKITPIIPNTTPLDQMNVRDRAQNLQIYLDKFLEYTFREMTKLKWQNPESQLTCARFLFEKICSLYIVEVFPKMEGINVFGGPDDAEEDQNELLDTADPLVIARYWLIRWVVNIALSGMQEDSAPGLLLFRRCLYAAESPVNMLFTMLHKAMFLPLACSSVIQKVLSLIRAWLLKAEIPPFFHPNWQLHRPSEERVQVLLVDFLFSFFRSPYISACGDRFPTVLAITQTIMDIIRDLTQPHSSSFSSIFWQNLLMDFCSTTYSCCNEMLMFDKATVHLFIRSLLSAFVNAFVFRNVKLSVQTWDALALIFKRNCSDAAVEQWSIFVDFMTYALALNNLDMELNPSLLHPMVSKALQQDHSTHYASGDASSLREETFLPSEYTRLLERVGQSPSWYRCWLRLVSLVSASDKRFGPKAVQTIDRSIRALLEGDSAHALVQWLGAQLLESGVAEAIAALATVLVGSNPPDSLRAQILARFRDSLQNPQLVQVFLQQYTEMNVEDSSVMATDTVNTLKKLAQSSEFTSQAVEVAAVLALNNPEAEQVIFSILRNNSVKIDVDSLAKIINSFSIIALERDNFDNLFAVLYLISQRNGNNLKILAQFCANFYSAKLKCKQRLADTLESAIMKSQQLKEDRIANEIKWQIVTLLSTERIDNTLKTILANMAASGDDFFEGFLIQRALQFPLPGFSVSQWNSVYENAPKDTKLDVIVQKPKAIISFEKNGQDSRIWSRTVVGRHCYSLKRLTGLPSAHTSTHDWLVNLSQSSSIKELPPEEYVAEHAKNFTPSESEFSQVSASSCGVALNGEEVSKLLLHLKTSSRTPKGLDQSNSEFDSSQTKSLQSHAQEWRVFMSDMQFTEDVRVPASEQNFPRDLRHLDQTLSREVHKVALIYVGMGQEDKQSILSNSRATPAFDDFVSRLGWPADIGPDHHGYTGGLPTGHVAPYYANSACELIFHVSTRLSGSITQKLKHLGNDEVHVIWTEHNRPYRRDVIATRFCDVMIVLQPVSVNLVKVRVEVQHPDIQFGPLFDGAQVHIRQLPELVRETVINASRIYRIRQTVIPRPNKHRETVFQESTTKLKPVSISHSICSSYMPSLKA